MPRKLVMPCFGALIWIGLALGPAVLPAQAELIVLYDGNGLPAAQDWLAYVQDGTATQSVVSGGVQLRTDLTTSAGYGNYLGLGTKVPNFPSLDRAQGFELAFTAQVLSESHASNQRAGFSVILLGSDHRGIELGFWESEIWAQTPSFTHGDGVTLETSLRRDYRLQVRGDRYTLFEAENFLLAGDVQDYSASMPIPYVLPNFIFLGDDTSSAGADLVLGPIALQTNLSAVPEPGSLGPLAIVLAALLVRHRPK